MKSVIVIADGAADFPIAQLTNQTPLQAAYIPHANYLAQYGTTGLIENVFDDLPIGSIVAMLGILGYDPYQDFPNGRASFEALAGGIKIRPNDLAFRCNLISTENQKIKDFTANQIEDTLAHNIVMGYTPSSPNIRVYPNQSYRNILVYQDASVPASSFSCSPPHQHLGESIETLQIKATTNHPRAIQVAKELNQFQEESIQQIKQLQKSYHFEADMFWLWSPSDSPKLPSFKSLFGVNGAMVGGLNFLKGIGISAKMLAPHIPGATGYIDSNLDEKLQTAIQLLPDVDVLIIHVNAPDEEAHQHNITGKLRAIELVDEKILGPIVYHLNKYYPEQHRIAFLPDHYTCLKDGKHIVRPVPFLVYGTGIARDKAASFNEPEIERKGSQNIKAWELMPFLLEP